MFTNINDLKIHYTVFETALNKNSGDIERLKHQEHSQHQGKQNIIILPGWGCSVNVYQKIQNHLLKKYDCRIYAIDFPGQGLSPPPFSAFGTENYANIIVKFIQNLNIKNPWVLGHSLGGKVALYASAKKLMQPSKLILIDSAGIKSSVTWKKKAKLYAYKIMKFVANLPYLRVKLLPRFLNYKNKIGSQDYCNANGVMRQTLVKLVNEDWQNLLTEITVPTLLIWGENDEATPLYQAKIMHSFIQNSHLAIIPNAEHFPFLDNFDLFIKHIEEFCNE